MLARNLHISVKASHHMQCELYRWQFCNVQNYKIETNSVPHSVTVDSVIFHFKPNYITQILDMKYVTFQELHFSSPAPVYSIIPFVQSRFCAGLWITTWISILCNYVYEISFYVSWQNMRNQHVSTQVSHKIIIILSQKLQKSNLLECHQVLSRLI